MQRSTWVLVAHRAGARIFKYLPLASKLKLLEELDNPAGRLKPGDIKNA
jgi:hypothetical protein